MEKKKKKHFFLSALVLSALQQISYNRAQSHEQRPTQRQSRVVVAELDPDEDACVEVMHTEMGM